MSSALLLIEAAQDAAVRRIRRVPAIRPDSEDRVAREDREGLAGPLAVSEVGAVAAE